MAMDVNGFTIHAPFIFVCDGKVYRSYTAKNWTVIFSRYGTQAWGHDTYSTQRVDRSCPPGRNNEVLLAFRGAVMRHFKLNHTQIEAFLQRQVDEDKQILVEGNSVKRHVGGSSSSTNISRRSAISTISAPAEKHAKREKSSPEDIIRHMASIYVPKGLPAEDVAEFHEWFRKRTGRFHGVKLVDVIAIFLAEERTSEVSVPEDVEPEVKTQEKPRKRTLVEEREHKEDIPYYGRRRRNQEQFHEDVDLNCGGRCVFTLASGIRCEAAHLLPHARKGGASFKNGLLLRSDIHKLFDVGLCAIDPKTLKIWFVKDILDTDSDLVRYNGTAMRPTMHPIKADNLQVRWDAFCVIHTA